MREWAFTIILLSTSVSVHAATCDLDDPQAKRKVDYINERYDDFFRFQQAKEEHEKQLATGVPAVKAAKEERELQMKRAALEYRREKKDYAKEEAMRVEWEAAQKEKVKEREIARNCEVQQRRAAEELLKKGRKIPELKEFDLEDY